MGGSGDERLVFPGFQPDSGDRAPSKAPRAGDGGVSPPGSGQLGIPGLSADQEKAVQLALSGLSYVMVAIQPTDGGADFYTAVHGQPQELADAQPHLEGVIARALRRHGVG